MKKHYSLALLLVLLNNCGAGSPPASAPAVGPASSAAPDSVGAHAMHAPMPAADSPAALEPSLPAPATSASPSAAVSAAPNAAASQASEASPAGAAKGTLTLTVTSIPTSAAKQAVVYLEDLPKDREIAGSMDNRQMAFVPHILVVTAGSKITFSNSDPFPHNVFSPDNEKWDMGVIPAKGARVRRFERTGFYTVLCNMHPNMKAYIAVVPSSYFAKVDKSGQFTIKDIPPGKHEVIVWAPGVKSEHREVVVDGDTSLAVELHK